MTEAYRKISVVLELDRAVKYLRLGLIEVQKITPVNDFYDPVFIFLSGGLERLFKTMLCLNHLEKQGRLPNPNEIWKNNNGHDLLFLKSKVENICVDLKRPFANKDYDIILNDEFINKICKTLSEFGKRSRYFDLDSILGVEQQFDSKKNWEKLETEISIGIYGKKKFYKLLSDPEQLDRVFSDSNKEIIIRLERFLRALTRQFLFGDFSKESKTFIFQIKDFTHIEDEQLGLTDYGKFKNIKRKKREIFKINIK